MENGKIAELYKFNIIKIIPSKGFTPCIELDLGAYGGMSISISEATFIKESLDQIITYYEKNSQETRRKYIGKQINIIEGRFKGLNGVITDVDTVDKKRPLVVKLDRNDEAEGYIFINWDEIELLEKIAL